MGHDPGDQADKGRIAVEAPALRHPKWAKRVALSMTSDGKEASEVWAYNLECSHGKGLTGISIGIPSSSDWDFDSPFKFCILCKPRTTLNEAIFQQELCSSFGNPDRTLIQKFDCGSGPEFLQGFHKANGSLDFLLDCSQVNEVNITSLTYESGFPIGQRRSRLARTNWEEFRLEVGCDEPGTVICGLEISTPASSSPYPALTPRCCPVIFSDPPRIGSLSTSASSSYGAQIWTAILAILVVILAIVIVLLVVQLCCYPVFPKECFGNNPDDYLPPVYPRNSLAGNNNKSLNEPMSGLTRSATTVISSGRNGLGSANNAVRPLAPSVRPKSNGTERNS
eukprot:maker-scaffold368_size193847-snap-gene-0.33 protein:Tk10001 transcript:maker-scaffold368_size193847-snap-gene-0.33-mRNA-1 annotation:"phosphoribosylaminoimidazole-succinocarboxamide synthase"